MKYLLPELLLKSSSSTKEDMVGFLLVFALANLYTEQADISDVVLCARIRTTGQMDINWLIEMQLPFEVSR